MNTFKNIVEKSYSWVTMICMAIGLIVAFMFIVSIIFGGNTGESLAIAAGTLMTWAIRFATVAVLIGLIYIYLSKQHTLTMDSDGESTKETSGDKKESKVV